MPMYSIIYYTSYRILYNNIYYYKNTILTFDTIWVRTETVLRDIFWRIILLVFEPCRVLQIVYT